MCFLGIGCSSSSSNQRTEVNTLTADEGAVVAQNSTITFTDQGAVAGAFDFAGKALSAVSESAAGSVESLRENSRSLASTVSGLASKVSAPGGDPEKIILALVGAAALLGAVYLYKG